MLVIVTYPLPELAMNARQDAFCQAYVICLDAQEAALQAGYSPRRAKQTGYDLLQLHNIQAQIRHLKEIRDANFGIKAADVLREIADIAMSDIGGLLTWGMEHVYDDEGVHVTWPDGTPIMRPFIRPLKSRNLTSAQRRAIKSLSMSRNGVFKVELHDRLKSLELLGRHLGLFDRKSEQKIEATADTLHALVAACQGAPLLPTAMVDVG